MQSMQDFPNKMTSLGEVQRIIGLSLSKIQMGRNQRGGLPLHKNLLVATVLNKARDLYMQETMYMNYKMMTGQFGAGPIGVSYIFRKWFKTILCLHGLFSFYRHSIKLWLICVANCNVSQVIKPFFFLLCLLYLFLSKYFMTIIHEK